MIQPAMATTAPARASGAAAWVHWKAEDTPELQQLHHPTPGLGPPARLGPIDTLHDPWAGPRTVYTVAISMDWCPLVRGPAPDSLGWATRGSRSTSASTWGEVAGRVRLLLAQRQGSRQIEARHRAVVGSPTPDHCQGRLPGRTCWEAAAPFSRAVTAKLSLGAVPRSQRLAGLRATLATMAMASHSGAKWKGYM